MQRITPLSSLPDEKITTPDISSHDLPLNLTSSIKLLSDIIALSKFFLKKPTIQKISTSEAADTLITEILSLDIERETPKGKRYKLSASYVAMAKADLFPNTSLTKDDRESLLKFGFLNPMKQGEHVSFYMKRKQIFQYIDQYVKLKYQEKLKQIIDRACALAIIGFSSYNLLTSRRAFDKSKPSIATAFDPQNTIATEKGNIIKLIEEISNLKPSTTHSGDITRYQKEIASDIDQMRNTFEGIELELIKTESKHKQQQLDILIPAILKTQPPLIELEQYKNTIELYAAVRLTKSKEQLLKEIDEIETRQAYVLARITTQKNASEMRTLNVEKQLQELNLKYDTDCKKLENTKVELETKNKILSDNLAKTHATIEILNQELKTVSHNTTRWHYGLMFLGFAVGAILCASGIGLLAVAPILGIASLTLGGIILLGDTSYIGYSIYQHCKPTNQPPSSPAPTMRITTNLTQTIALPNSIELKSDRTKNEPEDKTLISTKPMFSPKSKKLTYEETIRQKLLP